MSKDQVNESEIDDGSASNASVEEKPDTSIRGSIKAALEETKREASDDESDAPKKAEQDEGDKPARKKHTEKQPVSAKGADDSDAEEKQPDDKQEKSEQKDSKQASTPAEKLRPPVGWTKEGKANWDNLPPDVQKSVLKREEEFSNGIKQYADKAKSYDELDQVIAPYKQMIASYGVTPAQTVDRLFKWMNALSHQDVNVKANAFKSLAQSFGFDISSLAPQQSKEGDQENASTFDPSIIDQRLSPVLSEVQQLKKQQEEAQAAAAAQLIANWSKDKPYFNEVRTDMYRLIESGAVPPLPNGDIDLDTAYNKAVRLNENVWDSIQLEEQQKREAAAREQAEKEAKAKAEQLRKARNINVAVKSAAPSMRVNTAMTARPQAPNRKESVRDSLRRTFQEMREGE